MNAAGCQTELSWLALYDGVTPLLRAGRQSRHRLKSRERVDLELAVAICKCLHGLAPQLQYTWLTAA